jgi:hypothetical protein
MTGFDGDDIALPGLDPARAGAGANELAARRTIAALAIDGHVGETESVMCEGLLTAARQLDRAAANGRSKDYGVAELLGQLRELYKVLIPPVVEEEGSEPDAWTDFLDQLARGDGGSSPVRDPAEP